MPIRFSRRTASGSRTFPRKEQATFISSFGRFTAATGPVRRCRSLARITSAGHDSTSASGIFISSLHGCGTDTNCWLFRTGTWRWVRGTCGGFQSSQMRWLTGRKSSKSRRSIGPGRMFRPMVSGSSYASTAGAADQYNHLYVLPIEGGQPYKLTFGDHDDFHPRWSPDGESIAYISNEEGLPQLYVLETNGGGKRKVEIRQRHWKQPMSRGARCRSG